MSSGINVHATCLNWRDIYYIESLNRRILCTRPNNMGTFCKHNEKNLAFKDSISRYFGVCPKKQKHSYD